MADYHGHMTKRDGSHVPLTADEAQALWDESERQRAEIAARLPDENSALRAMCEAFHRLKDFGWRDAIYCPKDGTVFDSIEAGSTGIFDCYYTGNWPEGSWWTYDGDDLWPGDPILFRLKPKP